MSDPVSQPDIDDVLASIRRLVSEDGRAERRRPPAGGGRLVLTPALRIDESSPEDAPDEPGQASSAVTGADDAPAPSMPPEDTRSEPAARAEDALPGNGDAAQDMPEPDAEDGPRDHATPSDAEPAAGHAPDAGGESFDEGAAPRSGEVEAAQDDGWTVTRGWSDRVDEIIFNTPTPTPTPAMAPAGAHDRAGDAADDAGRPRLEPSAERPADPARDAGGVDEAEAWQDSETAAREETPKGRSETVPADALRTATLEQKIAELEALLSRGPGGRDDSEAASQGGAEPPARSGEDGPAGPVPGAAAADDAGPSGHSASDPGWTVVSPVAGIAPARGRADAAAHDGRMAVEPSPGVAEPAPEAAEADSDARESAWHMVTPVVGMPAAAPAGETRDDARETGTGAQPRAGEDEERAPESYDFASDGLGSIDEDALRDLVAQIVREELQGALGERITRNVRKLVRREIHRALTAQDLD